MSVNIQLVKNNFKIPYVITGQSISLSSIVISYNRLNIESSVINVFINETLTSGQYTLKITDYAVDTDPNNIFNKLDINGSYQAYVTSDNPNKLQIQFGDNTLLLKQLNLAFKQYLIYKENITPSFFGLTIENIYEETLITTNTVIGFEDYLLLPSIRGKKINITSLDNTVYEDTTIEIYKYEIYNNEIIKQLDPKYILDKDKTSVDILFFSNSEIYNQLKIVNLDPLSEIILSITPLNISGMDDEIFKQETTDKINELDERFVGIGSDLDDEIVRRTELEAVVTDLDAAKANKVVPSSENNIAILGSDGDLNDSGKTFNDNGTGNNHILSAQKTIELISKATAGKTYLGTWDVSTNTPNLPSTPTSENYEEGDYYDVSVAGTQFGIVFTVGDRIIVAKDVNTGNLFWIKDNQDKNASEIHYDNNTSGLGSDNTQDAIDELSQELKIQQEEQLLQNTNGFADRETSILSLVGRVLTITPDPEYVIFTNGKKYTITQAMNITIPDVVGLHYVYIDIVSENLSLVSNLVQDKKLFTDWAYVCNIYWNGSIAVLGVQDERHGISMSGDSHYYDHTTFGTVYKSGLITSVNADEDGSDDAHAQFAITSGLIADEDNEFTTPSKILSDNTPILYRLGTTWQEDTTNFIVKTGGTGRAVFNENVAGSYQLTEIDNNDFGIAFVVAGTSYNESQRIFVVMGNESYTTLSQARSGASQPPNLSGLPFQEYKVIAGIIFQTNDNYTNAFKTRIRSADGDNDYIDWRTLSITGAGSSVSDIANLQNQIEAETAARNQANVALAADIETLDTNKADKTTTITAGNGLTGGGDLSTDRTLEVDFATDWQGISNTLVVNQNTLYQALNSTKHYSAIYVDPVNGNDTTGNGTKANPYQTINKALNPTGSNPISSKTIYINGSTTDDITFEATNTSIHLHFDLKTQHTGTITLVEGNTAIYFVSPNGKATFSGTINDGSKGTVCWDAIVIGTYNKTGGSGTIQTEGYVEFSPSSNVDGLEINLTGNATVQTLGTGSLGQLTQSNGLFAGNHKGSALSPVITGGSNPLLGQPICLLQNLQLIANGSNKSLVCDASYGLVYLSDVSTFQNDFTTYGQIDFTGSGVNCFCFVWVNSQLATSGDVPPATGFQLPNSANYLNASRSATNYTSTGDSVKQHLDGIDNKLGTTYTKKEIDDQQDSQDTKITILESGIMNSAIKVRMANAGTYTDLNRNNLQSVNQTLQLPLGNQNIIGDLDLVNVLTAYYKKTAIDALLANKENTITNLSATKGGVGINNFTGHAGKYIKVKQTEDGYELSTVSGGGILQVAEFANLPATGEDNVLYLTEDNNKLYSWNGSDYEEASPSETPDDVVTSSETSTLDNDFVLFDGTTGKIIKKVNLETFKSLLSLSSVQTVGNQIIVNDVASPTDANADGGGLKLQGTTDKGILWDEANTNWTSSEHFNVADGKSFKINDVDIKETTETLLNKTLNTDNNNIVLGNLPVVSGGVASGDKVEAAVQKLQNQYNGTFQWNITTITANATLTANHRHIIDSASQIELTLDATPTVGAVYHITGKGTGGFVIKQNANQKILVPSADSAGLMNIETTAGVSGFVKSMQPQFSCTLQYLGNDEFLMIERNLDEVFVDGFRVSRSPNKAVLWQETTFHGACFRESPYWNRCTYRALRKNGEMVFWHQTNAYDGNYVAIYTISPHVAWSDVRDIDTNNIAIGPSHAAWDSAFNGQPSGARVMLYWGQWSRIDRIHSNGREAFTNSGPSAGWKAYLIEDIAFVEQSYSFDVATDIVTTGSPHGLTDDFIGADVVESDLGTAYNAITTSLGYGRYISEIVSSTQFRVGGLGARAGIDDAINYGVGLNGSNRTVNDANFMLSIVQYGKYKNDGNNNVVDDNVLIDNGASCTPALSNGYKNADDISFNHKIGKGIVFYFPSHTGTNSGFEYMLERLN